jgi:hypothetical protein
MILQYTEAHNTKILFTPNLLFFLHVSGTCGNHYGDHNKFQDEMRLRSQSHDTAQRNDLSCSAQELSSGSGTRGHWVGWLQAYSINFSVMPAINWTKTLF